MVLDKDLLQINATVITGILILLTITNVAAAGGRTYTLPLLAYNTVWAIFPFIGSAAILLVSNCFSPIDRERLAGPLTLLLTTTGFIVLAIVLIIYFLIPAIHPNFFPELPRVSSQNVTHPTKPAG